MLEPSRYDGYVADLDRELRHLRSGADRRHAPGIKECFKIVQFLARYLVLKIEPKLTFYGDEDLSEFALGHKALNLETIKTHIKRFEDKFCSDKTHHEVEYGFHKISFEHFDLIADVDDSMKTLIIESTKLKDQAPLSLPPALIPFITGSPKKYDDEIDSLIKELQSASKCIANCMEILKKDIWQANIDLYLYANRFLLETWKKKYEYRNVDKLIAIIYRAYFKDQNQDERDLALDTNKLLKRLNKFEEKASQTHIAKILEQEKRNLYHLVRSI